MKTVGLFLAAAGAAAFALAATPADAQQRPRVSIGLPGIPPVFVTVQAYVAQQEKFFEKHGVDVTLRPFDSGAAAARAVVAGDVELSLSPSPLVANMISNANVDLVAIYGNERPTWRIASMDPSKNRCEHVKGQPVGVDSIGGARSVALTQMLSQCGLRAEDTQQVALSSNVGAAMAGGQIQLGVLHVDDVPVIERTSGKKLTTVVDINDVHKVNHYMALTTTRKRVAEQRDTFVRVIAALKEAERFISDPKNLDRVAKAAAPTGRSVEDARWAIPVYVKLGFWPSGSGLNRENIEAIIEHQQRVGGIRPNVKAVTFDRFVDTTLYDEAAKMVK